MIDGVELSTDGGHYIAVGLPQAQYPLRGESRDVVADVRRLGGFGIIAHPDSTKPALQWRDWDVPFDAIEWLNADSEWRDESRLHLARSFVQYPFGGVGALGSLMDRPEATLARWDRLSRERRVVAVTGSDAHARTGWTDEDRNAYLRGWFLRIPSYEVSFRAFATRVRVGRPLTGGAAEDAAHILSALKDGRAYSGIDAIASPAMLEFTASAQGQTASQGALIQPQPAVTFNAASNAPGGGIFVLRKDGAVVAQTPNETQRWNIDATYGAGTYRIEVHLRHSPGTPPVPWIVSNPIYVQPAGWGVLPEMTYTNAAHTRAIQGGPWHVEKDSGSVGDVTQTGVTGPVTFTYQLAGGDRGAQYAALGIGTGGALGEATRLAFRGRASQPMRISLQARRPQSGERWKRSIYLDGDPRDIIVPFSELMPVGSAPARFDPARADTVLFVADLTNADPGATGSFTIEGLRVER